MTEKIISTESTGGEGFVFEKQVDAYFLVCLLNGKTPFEDELGPISSIEFQTRNKGWFIDDILLTLDSKKGTRRLALSVTSNKKRQFKSKAAPKDFVDAVWKQYLGEERASQIDFIKDQDLLGLICLSVPEDVELLLKYVRERHSEWSYEKSNKNQQAFFDSFACPNTEFVQKYNLSEDDTVKFLKCIRVYDFDFNKPVSRWKKKALGYCRDALRDEERADDLWNELQSIADEYRPAGGYLSRKDLVDKVRCEFRLKEFPDYRSAWKILQDHTDNNLNRIRDTIGGKVTIPRNEELTRLEDAFNQSKSVVLLGLPGCGKTVLSKLFVQARLEDGQVVWLDSSDLSDLKLQGIDSKLKYPLKEILSSATDTVTYLIIDGLDKTFDEAVFKNLHPVLDSLRLDDQNSPWRILITSQIDEWFRVKETEFKAANIELSWGIVDVTPPKEDELDEVWKAFPKREYLKNKTEVRDLLIRPKILDILVSNPAFSKSTETSHLRGESDLIESFWLKLVRKGPHGERRSEFLKWLSKKQADDSESETPLETLNRDDLDLLDSLKKDGVCRVYEEKVAFDHSLFGYWARQRILIGQENNLKDFLQNRQKSPIWQSSIRLYGQHLLERKGFLEWKSTLSLFNTKDWRTIQYSLLENAILEVDPLELSQTFEYFWPHLANNKATLLHRILVKFLHVATEPNPQIIERFRELELGSGIEASIIERLPKGQYWRPMIRFLYSHLQEILELDSVHIQVVEVVYKWLMLPIPELDLRKEAAEIALAIAERTRRRIKEGISYSEELRKLLYKAVPSAAGDIPERFTRFVLDASGRIAPFRGREIRKRRMTDPWPNGPKQQPDSAFQKVCLAPGGLNRIILTQPKLAIRLILALLIDPPYETNAFIEMASSPRLLDDLNIYDDPELPPPFYTWGSFLFFLGNKPKKGLEVIIRLVNFATERWAERLKKHEEEPPTVKISLPEGDHELTGDNRVYFWYRDNSFAPKPVVAALMALEQWLYDRIEKGKPINEIIEYILKEARSVAFAGVLNAMGKKDPSLFLTTLKPLLTAQPEFHLWEHRYKLTGNFPLMVNWLNYGEKIFNQVRDWHRMPHRNLDLERLALGLFLQSKDMQRFFEKVRAKWQARLDKNSMEGPIRGYLEKLILWFDLSNWEERDDPKHGRGWFFKPPKEFEEKSQEALRSTNENILLLTFPTQCAERLDKNQSLPPESLEELWTTIQRISQMTPPTNEFGNLVRIEDSICGGAAVLLYFHRDWLKQHPDREEWCVKQILETIKNPPQPSDYDDARSISSPHQWDGFCARVLPLLWAENLDLKEIRKCIALLLTDPRHFHYKTVELLFEYASRLRKELGKDFLRFQHLVLRWAGVRWWYLVSRNFSKNKPRKPLKVLLQVLFSRIRYMFVLWDKPYIRFIDSEKARIDTYLWLNKARKAFVTKFISEEVPTFEEVVVKNPSRRKVHSRWKTPGIDSTLIKSAHGWLPSLDKATDERERKEWIKFWKDVLNFTINALEDSSEDNHDVFWSLQDWNHWLLGNIASIIPQLKKEEEPQHFWKPILNWQVEDYYFIQLFLSEWFRKRMELDQPSEAFIREWKSMLDFAFSSTNWSFDSSVHRFHLDELWGHLIGLDWISMGVRWKEEKHKSLVLTMKDYYERWAKLTLDRSTCMRLFISFLNTPAAEGILPKALVWIDEALGKVQESYWKGHDLKKRLSSLLCNCWESQISNIRQDTKAFSAFKTLVIKLAGYGDPGAMEIQSKIGRRQT